MPTLPYDPRYLAGLRLYHLGRYWDSHEEWEAIWRESTGPERHFYQGLIQVDAAIIHTQQGHWGGVANLLARSLGHLEQCPDHLLGMDVARLRSQLRAYRQEILALGEDLPRLWQADTTTPADRKYLLRLVIKEVMLKNTVDGEFTTTGDVSEVAVFLASFPTNALTGQSLNVTHGWHME